MKAVRLTGLRKMELQEVPEPLIEAPDQVLLRMRRVGVCGSDVHYFTTGRIGTQVVQYPFTPGHECAALVEQVGAEVHHLQPGDHVAVDPAMACRQCDQCRSGRPHTCRRLRFLGCPGQATGCLSELLVMPAESCFRMPDGMTWDQAVLSEPVAIGYYAARMALPLKGAQVGILGCGPIGLSALKGARLFGVADIYALDPLAYRAQAAQSAGAAWTGDPAGPDPVGEIKARTPAGLDVVFECCGQQAAVDQALELLRPGGRLMLIGIPETDRISLIIEKARRAEVRVLNVRRQCACTSDTLALMAQGLLEVDFMVTHRVSPPDAGAAFEMVAGYRDGVIKVMIQFDD